MLSVLSPPASRRNENKRCNRWCFYISEIFWERYECFVFFWTADDKVVEYDAGSSLAVDIKSTVIQIVSILCARLCDYVSFKINPEMSLWTAAQSQHFRLDFSDSVDKKKAKYGLKHKNRKGSGVYMPVNCLGNSRVHRVSAVQRQSKFLHL